MNAPTAHVPAPVLEWRDGMPVSAAFDDVYFSRAGGVAETEHVFLRGNGLPERWQDRAAFTIGEMGFGTGLNFLVALKQFRATASAGAVLHYVAIEKFPLPPDALRAALAAQPGLEQEAAELIAAYPLRLPGVHRITLDGVRLTLCFGDVAALLPDIRTPIDAWFLDGFSPARNPEMWAETLWAELARLSAPEATLATFTAAGQVRRGLQAAGFVIEKQPGFGHKRDMLVGRYTATDQALPSRLTRAATAIVIGAGIAGATVARALAERGYAVMVLERGVVAGGASGNAAGVLFPQLTKRWNTSSAWYFTAYGYALRQLRRWQAEGLRFELATTGMLRLPRHADEDAQLRALHETHGFDPAIVHWLDRDDARAQAGVALPTGAAFFPEGSWVNPSQLCASLLAHPKITLREHASVTKFARTGQQWGVTLADGEVIPADLCCIAAAGESAQWLANEGITLGAVGGQVSVFAAGNAASSLRSIVCHRGYVIPTAQGLLVGATYHRDDMLAVTPARHDENREALLAILPQWHTGDAIAGRSSIRATTPDRLPYIGALAHGLYVTTGHGSRGLLSAPLAAEIIASDLTGETPPVTQALLKAVHPLRFRKG
ncbi:MAG: bifunctional tRNA (5-methylaminomethyl-2-thiouridine)(34)-methyltransferase MnmD/FAD-dependent 5-carboxymethylaminomethyl-2-thiouridine(34) oxidoreductase MnmC [Alphaproteobacteria bacterium]|nr:bifunctional tRNA (5-methylaminomethyl-2-thiouridine)(34)-methyltransferase MnmD/FAD-dependent 5-carboxymethylaminomethyl-2-thiouridine(34) oxidoreductase MnmC [Alphaproteobacteria bacterium]